MQPWFVFFLLKLFFPEGMGVSKMVVEIPKEWGSYFSGPKMEIPGGVGG